MIPRPGTRYAASHAAAVDAIRMLGRERRANMWGRVVFLALIGAVGLAFMLAARDGLADVMTVGFTLP